jgi:hypothetical protein
MQKKSALWPGVLLGLAFLLLAACASGGGNTRPAVTLPTGEMLYVLAGSGAGQQFVALHPGAASAPLVTLPLGVTTLDHQRLYTVAASKGTTTITVFATRTGARLHAFAISGSYATDETGYGDAALSPDGRWLALRDLGSNQQQTTIVVVDTQAGKVAKLIKQPGDFTLDAISPDGQTLYLLQQLHDAEHHYYVRALYVASNQLDPNIIVDKSELDEQEMAGQAVTRQMLADGTVAHTLYLNPAENKAFIHILPVAGGGNGPTFARCLDLPSNAALNVLAYYSLSLSPNRAYLYAANAVLGMVVKISLDGQQVFDDTIALQQQFAPGSSLHAPKLYNGSALSADGAMLYVVGGDGLWALDASTLHVIKHYLAGEAFSSVALSADGKSLYALDPAKGLIALNLASGQASQVAQSGLASAVGIAWVSA